MRPMSAWGRWALIYAICPLVALASLQLPVRILNELIPSEAFHQAIAVEPGALRLTPGFVGRYYQFSGILAVSVLFAGLAAAAALWKHWSALRQAAEPVPARTATIVVAATSAIAAVLVFGWGLRAQRLIPSVTEHLLQVTLGSIGVDKLSALADGGRLTTLVYLFAWGLLVFAASAQVAAPSPGGRLSPMGDERREQAIQGLRLVVILGSLLMLANSAYLHALLGAAERLIVHEETRKGFAEAALGLEFYWAGLACGSLASVWLVATAILNLRAGIALQSWLTPNLRAAPAQLATVLAPLLPGVLSALFDSGPLS